MATVKKSETKEAKLNREIKELRNQLPGIDDEIKTGWRQEKPKSK